MLLWFTEAHAVDKVGEFTASGLFFKDSVNIVAIEDEQGGHSTGLKCDVAVAPLPPVL
jgi:hypothetical protein